MNLQGRKEAGNLPVAANVLPASLTDGDQPGPGLCEQVGKKEYQPE